VSTRAAPATGVAASARNFFAVAAPGRRKFVNGPAWLAACLPGIVPRIARGHGGCARTHHAPHHRFDRLLHRCGPVRRLARGGVRRRGVGTASTAPASPAPQPSACRHRPRAGARRAELVAEVLQLLAVARSAPVCQELTTVASRLVYQHRCPGNVWSGLTSRAMRPRERAWVYLVGSSSQDTDRLDMRIISITCEDTREAD